MPLKIRMYFYINFVGAHIEQLPLVFFR